MFDRWVVRVRQGGREVEAALTSGSVEPGAVVEVSCTDTRLALDAVRTRMTRAAHGPVVRFRQLRTRSLAGLIGPLLTEPGYARCGATRK